MSDRLIASIRTAVAAGVAAVILWATNTFGLEIDSELVVAAVLAVTTALYNALVNWLAARWPYFGYLLGIPRSPSYASHNEA